MRLFFALWPAPPLRDALDGLAAHAQAAWGGRRPPAASLHLTLAFLGEVPAERVAALVTLTEGLGCPAGRWTLDRFGHFRRGGILWLGSRAPAPALEALQRTLWRRLADQGLAPPARPFLPHVTLLRHCPPPALTAYPEVRLSWHYNQVKLIHSVAEGPGRRYACLAESATA